MSCVLVTGGSGFIGLHLVEALVQRGLQVRCLVRTSSRGDSLQRIGAELVPGALDQPESLQAAAAGASTVYHLAGVTKSLRPEEMASVNELGALAIAQACRDQPERPRLVVVSSIAASGPAKEGQIRIESDPPAPVSNYGRSKLAGEQAVARFAGEVPITIVRPGIVFGPRDAALAKMLKTIRRIGFHPSPGFAPSPLSYIYVLDLVEILIRAAERGSRLPAGENGSPGQGRYFAVANEYPTYADLGRLVRPMLRRPLAPVVPLARPVAWCAAGASELVARCRGRQEEFNFDKLREAFAGSWACSNDAVRRDLDFVPPKPLALRLQETIDWYLNEGWL